MTFAFQPGMSVEGDTVRRTFEPSCVITDDGTVIAFCQGRLWKGRDDDPKVLLMSRSRDGGATWSAPKAISGPMNHFAVSAYLSERNGQERVSVLTAVGLLVTEEYYENDHGRMKDRIGIDIDVVGRDTPTILCRFDSDDGGDTWTMDILTGDRSPLNRRYADGTLVMFNAIGQVHVIPEGPHEGRYILAGPVKVVPATERVSKRFRDHRTSGSAVIYSDNQGETWRVDGFITDYLANEASAVSIKGGKELLMIRRLNPDDWFVSMPPTHDLRPGRMQRIAHTSSDCGRTWSPPFLVDISGARCHGMLTRADNLLLFSIPTGPLDGDWSWEAQRHRGAIYHSADEGKTWKHKIVEPGMFSYSTIARLNESQYLVLFARNYHGQDGIGCRVFDKQWLTM